MTRYTDEASWVLGLHAVKSALTQGTAVAELLVDAKRQDDRIKEVLDLAHRAGIKCRQVKGRVLDELAQKTNHQGVALLLRQQQTQD
ncbi:MAG: 23S rRNA (guanosine(2251)-2'-O)-methyltransferase RlmB, partial [Candidatus Thiodiazotropha sp. (ex Lucinoma kastoroae)]|nr:23S rRNA (guanosine(2251)-2'-O)-methyltransferase RlmB [Candidatus Thiodiazotropha sp. (ex Lucinoma kastoroae)]